MAFFGGAECSSAGNPLTQFTKHVQNDKSLQRDRLAGRSNDGLHEGIRARSKPANHEYMFDEFLQPTDLSTTAAPQPFSMTQMRRELENFPGAPRHLESTAWAAEFHPTEDARTDGNFSMPKARMMAEPGFSTSEFANFSQQSNIQRAPGVFSPGPTSSYQQPQFGMHHMNMGLGYTTMNSSYGPMGMQQQPQAQQDKGKGKLVELDDTNWEAQFAEIDATTEAVLDDEAKAAIETELNNLDRSVPTETGFGDFEKIWRSIQTENGLNRQMVNEGPEFDLSEWDNFDGGLNTHTFRDPQLGDYLFEQENPYHSDPNPFEEGKRMMREGANLSLAVLAFEAAVQKDPKHVEAWTMLGSSQAQNEKESPAIRAYERALQLDPSNLDALMGIAVSYTNEGYDTTAYRTLERWLAVKYPQIISLDEVTPDNEMGFTDRHLLLEKVTNLFIRAAQLSPHGDHMDPDVQVGLGVLFYGAEEYDKAVDCFSAALASNESGLSNQQEQVHLLWNRLGATLANSGRSEEAIEAYEKALTIRPNFVRARYNLGVSCINIGCYPEAAQHLLGALAMHQAVDDQESERFNTTGESGDAYITHNQSTNLYDTLRRVFNQMGRRDLSEMVVNGMDVKVFRSEFTF